jgi:hypothetical protein
MKEKFLEFRATPKKGVIPKIMPDFIQIKGKKYRKIYTSVFEERIRIDKDGNTIHEMLPKPIHILDFEKICWINGEEYEEIG